MAKYNIPDQPDTKWQFQLVDLLLACPSLATQASRLSVIAQLPDRLRHSLGSSPISSNKQDVMALIKTVLSFPNSLESLIEVVEFYDGGTLPFNALLNFLQSAPASPSNSPGGSASPQSEKDQPTSNGPVGRQINQGTGTYNEIEKAQMDTSGGVGILGGTVGGDINSRDYRQGTHIEYHGPVNIYMGQSGPEPDQSATEADKDKDGPTTEHGKSTA